MKAAVLHAAGEIPRYETFDEPLASFGEAVVQVLAASLKPVDKQIASGSHYTTGTAFPAISGIDGVGKLPSGQRVFFGGVRSPYGAMAERAPVREKFTFAVPDSLSDGIAAALPNPAVSAWLSLSFRGQLKPGENVLILGATGVTGQLAIQIAKRLGAARVVAAGRNPEILGKLPALGADATISLFATDAELRQRFMDEAKQSGYHVVLDYLWGRPAEIFFEAIIKKEFSAIGAETRFVQVGENVAPTISLNASVLRSTAVTIMGTAGVPPGKVLVETLQKVLQLGATGELRIDTEPVPLADVESAWKRNTPGRRIVLVP